MWNSSQEGRYRLTCRNRILMKIERLLSPRTFVKGA